jgi:exosortase/archaeosortase family protein
MGTKTAPFLPRSLVFGIPLTYLWAVLIQHLSLTWSSSPQYGYGWAVPFLCIFLFVRNRQIPEAPVHRKTETPSHRSTETPKHRNTVLWMVLLASVALWSLMRFAQEAVPAWRGVSWGLAISTVGITMVVINLLEQGVLKRGVRDQGSVFSGPLPRNPWSRSLLFPLLFFLVAVPWPSAIEGWTIRGLTFLTSTAAVEVLNVLGMPAVRQGAVIEVGNGVVGINEACSGVRSFQATLMISLFLGGFYRMRFARFGLLVLAGLVLAWMFNVVRTSLLTWIAGRDGVAAIEKWHDPAGVAVLLACFCALLAIAEVMRNRRRVLPGSERLPNLDLSMPRRLRPAGISSASLQASAVLCVWLVATELGVAAWFNPTASRPAQEQAWTIDFPAGYADVEVSDPGASAKKLLQYDRGKRFAWRTADGAQWQAFFLEWLPGRNKGYLVQRHRPEKCMPMAGSELEFSTGTGLLQLRGISMAWRGYQFRQPNGQRVHMIYCYWEPGLSEPDLKQRLDSGFNVLNAIRSGARVNPSQKVFQMAVAGFENPEAAFPALKEQLEMLIRVEGTTENPIH